MYLSTLIRINSSVLPDDLWMNNNFLIINILEALLFTGLFTMSCSKEKDEMNYAPEADFTFTDRIDHFLLTSNSVDINGDDLSFEWTCDESFIEMKDPFSSSAYFYLPIIDETRDVNIKLIVNDGQYSDTIVKIIPLPPTTLQRLYGLGIDLKNAHSNNVNYNWYCDQMNTGSFSLINCGPASVTMAIKWVTPDFTKSPEDARNIYQTGGGWWYTNDVINYLNLHSVNNYTIDLPHIDTIMSQIDMGNIIILCLDMYYIRFETKSNWHVDKFYSTSGEGWGHFIVIKGYQIVDDEVFYEAYDPYSFGSRYSDHGIKGENRFYRSEDLNEAVSRWWKYAIVVSKNTSKSAHLGVDTERIIHKQGL